MEDAKLSSYYSKLTVSLTQEMKEFTSLEDQATFLKRNCEDIQKILKLASEGKLSHSIFFQLDYLNFSKSLQKYVDHILHYGNSMQRSVIKSLFQFSRKELLKVIEKSELDISMFLYTKEFSYLVENQDFVLDALERLPFDSSETRALTRNFRSFLYEDSEELRTIIFQHPILYRKLAEAGLKPNLPKEVIKKFVSILGASNFVTRLSEELKEDSEFMRQIILENPIHLFRGSEDKYAQRIRENAFALFGDSARNLLEIYGMRYIVENANTKFLDFYEYIKIHGLPKETGLLPLLKEKLLTPEEQTILKLRYKISQEEFQFSNVPRKDCFEQLLQENFEALNIPYRYADLEKWMTKYQYFIDTRLRISEVMPIVNNIAVAIKNGTLDAFDEMVKLEGPKFAAIIDMNVLTRDVIDKIGLDNLSKLIYYPNSSFILSQLKKDGTLDLYAALLTHRPKSNLAPAMDVNVLLYSCYMYKEAILDLQAQGKLNEAMIENLIDITKNNRLLRIEKASDIENYYSNLKKFCDEEIKVCENVAYAKELLFARLLKTTRANAQEFIIKYKDGLKQKKSIDYAILETLEIVDGLQDLQAIKRFYKQISKFKVFQEHSFQDIDEKFKRDVLGEQYIQDSSFHHSKDTALEKDIIDYCKRQTGETPEVILLDPESKVQVLAHSLGAFGDTPDGKSIHESWNTKARSNMAGICTSLITNEMFRIAGDRDSVVLGFNQNISSEEVLMCAPYDMWSRSGRLYPDSMYCQSFIGPDQMPDEFREARGSTSEVVISRYKKEEKRQPDCILFFCYQQKDIQKSVEAAKSFNVPLVVIDEKKFLEKALSDIAKEEEDYKKSPTLEKAEKLFVHYETIKAGFGGIELDYTFKSSIGYQAELLGVLSQKEQEAFLQFVEEEKEKENVKRYKDDQQKVIRKGISKIRQSVFESLRNLHSVVELAKIRHMVESLPVMEEEGVKQNGR